MLEDVVERPAFWTELAQVSKPELLLRIGRLLSSSAANDEELNEALNLATSYVQGESLVSQRTHEPGSPLCDFFTSFAQLASQMDAGFEEPFEFQRCDSELGISDSDSDFFCDGSTSKKYNKRRRCAKLSLCIVGFSLVISFLAMAFNMWIAMAPKTEDAQSSNAITTFLRLAKTIESPVEQKVDRLEELDLRNETHVGWAVNPRAVQQLELVYQAFTWFLRMATLVGSLLAVSSKILQESARLGEFNSVTVAELRKSLRPAIRCSMLVVLFFTAQDVLNVYHYLKSNSGRTYSAVFQMVGWLNSDAQLAAFLCVYSMVWGITWIKMKQFRKSLRAQGTAHTWAALARKYTRLLDFIRDLWGHPGFCVAVNCFLIDMFLSTLWNMAASIFLKLDFHGNGLCSVSEHLLQREQSIL